MTPGDLRGRPGMRRLPVLSVLGLVAAAVLMLTPALASADSSTQLSIVGTSDVSDSGLMPNLIQPQFQAAFPQFAFKYTGSATGTAIQNAESGNGGPSVLIVHAASLENQFVAGGFSFQNQFGNAIFTNDFIVTGPNADPAAVDAGAPHNVAQAFADIANAGFNGGGTPRATFISRGGTNTASGTTVEEHTIWGLVNSAGLTPAGVVLCSVSAADGGGMSPISPTVQATSGQACPDSGTVSGTDAPSWYFINSGASQGANVVATNACTATGITSGANSCYSLTDRATFDFLISKNSPAAGTTGIPNLAILTLDNSASAPGGANALINYFHAYIINPSSPGETVNLTAAQDFISFITSTTIQSELKGYLAGTPGDAGGPPFVADASPAITASGLPSTIAAGKTVTVTGAIANREPGFPALAGQTVSIGELEGLSSVPVASGKTDATGGYSITFTPPSTGSYQASTGNISQVEVASLSPAYGDILSPAATTATQVAVTGSATITKDTASSGGVSVTGKIGPAAPDANGTVEVLARKQGSKRAFSTVGSTPLKAHATTYAANGSLGAGKWQIETRYRDPGQLTTATSGPRNLTVSGNIVTVSFKKVTIKRGKVTVSGTIGQPPATSGGKVELFFLKNGTTRFKQAAKSSIGKGKTKFTIKAKLKRGSSYALQLEYIHKGQTSSFSKLKSVAVR
jgi:tungstate transport system substrate-binding protein